MEYSGMVVDTSIFIDYLRKKNKKNSSLFKLPDDKILYVSVITVFELFLGATNEQKWQDVVLLTNDLNILPVTVDISKKAAKIFQDLKKRNKIIDFRDILIGATAITNNLPVVTHNIKHFERITGLEVL
jgi:tRNA(fMet)-specific endonuclease VapC